MRPCCSPICTTTTCSASPSSRPCGTPERCSRSTAPPRRGARSTTCSPAWCSPRSSRSPWRISAATSGATTSRTPPTSPSGASRSRRAPFPTSATPWATASRPTGARLAYISDHQAPVDRRSVDKQVLELCDGADLLIHDAQYTDDEFVTMADWGHSTEAYAVHVARESGARRLTLFHHDPAHTDKQVDRMLSHARRMAGRDHRIEVHRGGRRVIGQSGQGLTVSFDADAVQGRHEPLRHRCHHRVRHGGRPSRSASPVRASSRCPSIPPSSPWPPPAPPPAGHGSHGRGASASTCWATTSARCARGLPSPAATSSTASPGIRLRSPARR